MLFKGFVKIEKRPLINKGDSVKVNFNRFARLFSYIPQTKSYHFSFNILKDKSNKLKLGSFVADK